MRKKLCAALALVALVIAGGDPAVVPVPKREIVLVLDHTPRDHPPISATTDRLPLALPVACGANVTERLMLSSAARVMGKLGLLKLNAVPETDTCEMVMDLLRLVLVSDVESVLLLPSWTLPKLRVGVATMSCPKPALAHKTILRRSRCQVYRQREP